MCKLILYNKFKMQFFNCIFFIAFIGCNSTSKREMNNPVVNVEVDTVKDTILQIGDCYDKDFKFII